MQVLWGGGATTLERKTMEMQNSLKEAEKSRAEQPQNQNSGVGVCARGGRGGYAPLRPFRINICAISREVFSYTLKFDQPYEEVYFLNLIDVIQTQPRLWDCGYTDWVSYLTQCTRPDYT